MFQNKVVLNLLLAITVLVIAILAIRYLNTTQCSEWKEIKISDNKVYKERNCSK